METINDILSIIGAISLFFAIIRVLWVFVFSTCEWVDNVVINEYFNDEKIVDIFDSKGLRPQFYDANNDHANLEYTTATVFKPKNVIIKNVKVKKLRVPKNGPLKSNNFKYENVYMFKETTPSTPICIIYERKEYIPYLILEWKIEYGAIARYEFILNGMDGDTSLNGGIKYEFTWRSKLRKILDLK